MQNEIPLLYDYIKSEIEGRSLNIPENVIVALSNDISYKIHDIAMLSKSIMLKSNRNFLKDEDIQSALKLSFKNLLLVQPINEQNDKHISFNESHSDVIVKISSHSVSPLNLYNKCNFRLESDVVFSALLKNLLNITRNVYEHSLKFVRNRSDLNDIIIMLLSALNLKIDYSHNDELIVRACSILEAIVKNKSISLSENPWRDLCLSLSLKLLWSKINLRLKISKVSMILDHIIRGQYLMVSVMRNMVIDTLLTDLNQTYHDDDCHSGSLIGLIRLGYVTAVTIDHLMDKLNSLSKNTVSTTSMNEAVFFLLLFMKSENLFIHVPYSRLFHFIDSFSWSASIPLLAGGPCTPPPLPSVTQNLTSSITKNQSSFTSHIVPYNTVSNEIDVLLSGGSIDDLIDSSDCMDDLPPVLFRKPYIQPHIAHFPYSMFDLGFPVTRRQTHKFNIIISGVNPQLEEGQQGQVQFVSEFHSVFHRRRQFIENISRAGIRVVRKRILPQNNHGCVMNALFYAL